MKIEIFAHVDFEKDVIEVGNNLTEKEIEKAVYDYVSEFFDYRVIDKDEDTSKDKE